MMKQKNPKAFKLFSNFTKRYFILDKAKGTLSSQGNPMKKVTKVIHVKVIESLS